MKSKGKICRSGLAMMTFLAWTRSEILQLESPSILHSIHMGLMFKADAIKPLSDFVRNTKAHIEHLKITQEPQILTVNGEASIVV
jgi:hypothetical protein